MPCPVLDNKPECQVSTADIQGKYGQCSQADMTAYIQGEGYTIYTVKWLDRRTSQSLYINLIIYTIYKKRPALVFTNNTWCPCKL